MCISTKGCRVSLLRIIRELVSRILIRTMPSHVQNIATDVVHNHFPLHFDKVYYFSLLHGGILDFEIHFT